MPELTKADDPVTDVEDEIKQQNVALPAQTWLDLTKLAAEEGLTLRQYCAQVLVEHADARLEDVRQLWLRDAERAQRYADERGRQAAAREKRNESRAVGSRRK